MKVWVVPYAYEGFLQGVEVFDDKEKEKAQQFADEIHRKYEDREVDFFIQHKEVR